MAISWVILQDDSDDHPLACFSGDPALLTPDFNALPNHQSIVPIPEYGYLGFDEGAESLIQGANWLTCPNVDYCDGPVLEGAPETRYTTRWTGFYDTPNGLFNYGKVSTGTLTRAPLDLFPVPIFFAETFSLSFDANARPCFAYDIAGTCFLRRYVSGVPTTFSWTGSSPKMLFDGILQRDNTLTDVLCFYIRAGNVYVRIQRDNFAIEYLAFSLGVYGSSAAKINKTDRVGSYQYIYVTSPAPERYFLIVSPAYQPFPIPASDLAIVSFRPGGGNYMAAIVTAPTETDNPSINFLPGGGLYFPVVIPTGPYDDDPTANFAPGGGLYFLQIVDGGTSSDEGTISFIPGGGEYVLTVITTGPYTDSASINFAPGGGAYT